MFVRRTAVCFIRSARSGQHSGQWSRPAGQLSVRNAPRKEVTAADGALQISEVSANQRTIRGPVIKSGWLLTRGALLDSQLFGVKVPVYRALCTTSVLRFHPSTVGGQSSKKTPVEGTSPSQAASPPVEEKPAPVAEMTEAQPPQGDDPKKISQDEWRERLDRETFKVCRLKGTEYPGSGKYLHHSEKGTYICVCCRAPLFRSEDKFNHCGWPSFRQAMGTKANGSEEASNVKREYDGTHGMVRTEVLCKKCDSHLGHVFDDGPEPFGTRFCINSVSLDFLKDS